jgi:hypothetical protein
VIEEEIGFPVTNGGLSAAVSTAFALESYKPLLRAGDFCYLPLEYEPLLEYTRDQHLDLKFAMGYDRSRLSGYGFTDQVKGYFGYELGDVFQSLGEQIVVHQMKAYSSREEIDDRGDQVAYDREKATRFRDAVAGLKCPDVPGSEVFEEPPEMLVELGRFLDWCAQHDVKVIGGLPTTFEDTEIPDTLIDGLRGFYESRGHDFLSLPDRSCYPRADFYDSKYHLLPEPAVEHSRVIAQGLKRLIHSSREEARDR